MTMVFNRDLSSAWRKAGVAALIVILFCVPSAIHCQPPPLVTARAWVEAGKITEAKTLLDSYLKENPTSAEAHFLLGYIFFRQKMAKESLAEFTAGARTEAPSASDLKIVAADYIMLDDFSDADKWLTTVVTSSPQDTDAWYLLARTKYNENRFAEAIDSFNRALALRPRDEKSEDNLGLSYEGLNQPEKAKAAYQTAIEWQKDTTRQDAQPYLNLGTLLLHQGRAAEALPYLTRAVAAAPGNAKVHEMLSQAYIAHNNLPLAQKELEIAIKLAPRASGLHYKLGQLYHRHGMLPEAQREFAICSQLLSTHSSIDTPNLPTR